MRKALVFLLLLACVAGAYYKDLVVGDTAGRQTVINRVGTIDLGSTGTHFPLGVGDNGIQVIMDSAANVGGAYDDAIQAYIYGTTGDGTGAVRGIKVMGANAAGGSYAEIYGIDALAAQNDGLHTAAPTNLYNIMVTDNADVTGADVPTGYTGNFGIIDNSGGAAPAATVIGGLVGCVKDATNLAPDGVVSFFEGDSGVAPNNPTNSFYGVATTRSTATDMPAYGIDFDCAAAVPECRVADIRGQNQETLDNLTNNVWNFEGTIGPNVIVGTADAATQAMAGGNVLLMPSSAGPLAITDLTGCVVGATYNLVCNGGVNPFALADAGHFLLTAAWAGAQVGDNITVICLNNGVGTEVFAEVARSDN